MDPDLALDMKRVRQDDCADLDGLSLDLGKWVAAGKVKLFDVFSYKCYQKYVFYSLLILSIFLAGKVAVDSGLAYIMGLF